jgi:flagellar biosynthesis protein FlhG
VVSFSFDQAEGLRRLLGEPRQRVYTFLSALPSRQKNPLLFNLAASLARSCDNVMLFDATCSREGTGYYQGQHPGLTLAEAVWGGHAVGGALHRVPQGFDLACLAGSAAETDQEDFCVLAQAFESVIAHSEVVLIDAGPDQAEAFLPLTPENALVLLAGDSENAIKEAYMLIKQMAGRFGRMPFGVLVSGDEENRSRAIFRNMAQTAAQYLGVQLHFMGYVPKDDHMARAVSLGRSVVDAFPMALSSCALRRVAGAFSDSGHDEHGYRMAGA